MPDNFYIMYPRPESIRYFEQAMSRHTRVDNLVKIAKSYYEIHRDCMPTIKVFVSNFYDLSESDYLDVVGEFPDIDCLITISNWNKVTEEAYNRGKREGVGIFTMSDFMGAINCERPYEYIRSIDRSHNDRFD